MGDEVRFASDLYRGAAEYYDRFRVPYPVTMVDDVIRQSGAPGGRLLDLACGTGQLALPLRGRFSEVWAVDSEPGMIDVVRAKAAAVGAMHIRAIVSAAEDLHAHPDYFELAVIGNAFHRLRRDLVADKVFSWLRPGHCLALCWSSAPWAGERKWQAALAGLLDRWTAELGAGGRVPSGWVRVRRERPDADVLTDAGFEMAGRRQFSVTHRWSVTEIAGYIRSTSFMPPPVLSTRAAEFDRSLAAELDPYPDLTAPTSFAYDLARKPAPD